MADRGYRPEHPQRLSVESEGFTGRLRDRAVGRAGVEPDLGPDLGLGL